MSTVPPQGLFELAAWLGLLITGIWTAYKTHKNELGIGAAVETSRQARDELKNNHGSSKGDAIDRIEKTVTGIAERMEHVERVLDQHQILLERHTESLEHEDDSIKSLGHQIGESRAIARSTNDQLTRLIADHTERLREMEKTTKTCPQHQTGSV